MKSEIQEILNLVKSVEGWLKDEEGELLYELAKNCTGKGVIVEIGSWKGKSTIWLAKGSKAGKNIKIYAIDPHQGSPEHQPEAGTINTFADFQQNIKNASVDDLITPMVMTSKDASQKINQPVELIFIDGDHSYEMAKLDFELWFDKVIDEGWMAFHDTRGAWVGPKKVVAEYVYKSNRFGNCGFAGSITYAQKVARNSFTDRIKNRGMLMYKDLHSLGRIFRLLKTKNPQTPI